MISTYTKVFATTSSACALCMQQCRLPGMHQQKGLTNGVSLRLTRAVVEGDSFGGRCAGVGCNAGHLLKVTAAGCGDLLRCVCIHVSCVIMDV